MGGCEFTQLIYGCKLKFPQVDDEAWEAHPELQMDNIVEQFNAKHKRVKLNCYPMYPDCPEHECFCWLEMRLPVADGYTEWDSLPLTYHVPQSRMLSIGMELLLQHTRDWKQHEQELREAASELGENPNDIKIGILSVAGYEE